MKIMVMMFWLVIGTAVQASPVSVAEADSPARGKVVTVPANGIKRPAARSGHAAGIDASVKSSSTGSVGNNSPGKAGSGDAGQAASGRVVRSTLTSGIVDREPRDSILSLGRDEKKIYYFTELRGMKGRTATHRWLYQGKVMAEVKFTIKGDRWRIWSSKSLVPGWTGDWQVSVIDDQGRVLATNRFSYTRSSVP